MEKKVKKQGRNALRKGSYSIVVSIVIIAIVILLNKIVDQLPISYTQFDISTGKLYTIGQDTKDALKKLNQDVTIYLIAQKGSEDTNIEKLLEQYEANSKRIKVEKKDPIVNPSFTQKYTQDSISDNSLIVECGQRSKIITYSDLYESSIDYSTYTQTKTGFDGEGQITSAIAYVTSDSLPKVYYVEGHNEVAIPAELQSRIEKTNVELCPLSLLKEENVPEDAACILLNAPANDYSKEEAEKIMAYFEQGGRALILSDFIDQEMTNYNSLLEYFGIETVDGIVVESDKNHYVQKPYLLVPDIKMNTVTDGMTNGSQYVLVSGCQGFRVTDDKRESVVADELLATSSQAILKKNPKEMQSYEKEEGDVEGPFSVAMAISETDDATDESKHEDTRVVAIATSTLLDSSLNSSVADGNYTLYINALNWLVDLPETQTVSIPSKSLDMQFLTVTAAEGMLVSLIVCIILPFACFVVGGVVVFRRRRK